MSDNAEQARRLAEWAVKLPRTSMPDQPAPDFEEARRIAEANVQIGKNVQRNPYPRFGRGSVLESDLARRLEKQAGAYLALLSEREAREEVIEAAKDFHREMVGANLDDQQAFHFRQLGAALPATEPAHKEAQDG